uniref:NS1 n=1 Tax=Chufflevirus sp. TaxID=2814903 RepID=A0A897ZCP4_9VIRU|nr:NS1 [Chufflevirus sp.]
MQGEVESTGPSYRGFLWMGVTGTSGDIDVDQAQALFIEKDYVLSPLPETERFQNLINMKQWQCGIFQIADGRGEPFSQVEPYAFFFNQMVGIHHWFCTGEMNKDGIFHVHALFRTSMRTDSTRRAMTGTFNNLMLTSNYRNLLGTSQATMDCLKLQRCHKPSSMAQYMMKGPIWVCSNDDRMLQLAYDITLWKLNERFIPKPEEAEEGESDPSEEMNKVSRELVDLIIKCNCKTMQDCMRFGPDIMAKYLHRPGLNSIVQNCLEFVKASGATWNISLFEPYDPYPAEIHKILLHQGIEPSKFDEIFYAWITKSDSKKNTICIQGPSNTGKSAFISGLKQCIMWGEITNGNSGFNFEGLLEQNIGVWEEPLMGPELAEKAKQVFEGMVCSIPVKYKKPHMLPRTPIIITTNHDVWRYCQAEEPMFKNRMWIINFTYQCKDVNYYPRTCEHSCQCPYCRASRGGQDAAGVSSPGSMQSREQPIHTREQSPGLGTSTDVRTRSLPGPGEGPSISHSGTPSSSASGSDSQCSSSEQHHGSTSSSNVGHMGKFRIIRSSDPERRARTQPTVHVESHSTGGRDGNTSSSDGSRTGRKRGLGGNGDSMAKHGLPDTLGPRLTNEAQKGVRSKTKKQRVDESLGSRVGSIKLPMYVPSKQNWQEYLSYLHHWYG